MDLNNVDAVLGIIASIVAVLAALSARKDRNEIRVIKNEIKSINMGNFSGNTAYASGRDGFHISQK